MGTAATAGVGAIGTIMKETEAAYFLKKTEVLFMRFIVLIIVVFGFIYLINANKKQTQIQP
jgi:preprotein translocase subunit SecG